mgnify:FL=1
MAGDTTGIQHRAADDSLLTRGTITFATGVNSTTEILTSAIDLLTKRLAVDHRCLLVVDRTDDAVADTMTFKTYIGVKIDGVTITYVLVDTETVANVVGSRGTGAFVLDEGLGSGNGDIKFGALFAGDGTAITVNYALYAL